MRVTAAITGLSKQVKANRNQRELSIIGLANKHIGVSESTLRRIEKAGKTGYNPKLATLIKVSNALGVDINTLIGQTVTK